MLSQRDMRNILRHRCEETGSPTKWARENGFSHQFVYFVIRGEREVSDRLANALGYERKIEFYPCVPEKHDA